MQLRIAERPKSKLLSEQNLLSSHKANLEYDYLQALKSLLMHPLG